MRITRQRLIALGVATLLLVIVLASVIFLLARSTEKSPFANIQSDEWVIEVSQDGFYSLSLADLRKTGLSIDSLDPSKLSLSNLGSEVPFLIDDESLIFYGRSPLSRYSPTNPYILKSGTAGSLMEAIIMPELSDPVVASIPQTLRLEENLYYKSSARHTDQGELAEDEPWYWTTVQVESQIPIEFQLPSLADGPASIHFGLWGATYNDQVENDHDFDVLVNGQHAGTVRWDGESYFIGQLDLPNGMLEQGENTIIIDNLAQGATPIDIMDLDWIDIEFTSQPQAVDDKLDIWDTEGTVTIGGLSDEPRLFDITNPVLPKLIQGWDYTNEEVQLSISKDMHVMAIGPSGYLDPVNIRPVHQSDWRDNSHQADLIILTPQGLAPALNDLVKAREDQGLSVALVPVEELYDEFGFGHAGPESISDFLRFTSMNWADPKPRYLLLVGDATYDYRNYLGESPEFTIPSPMVEVEYSGETISDARLVDIDQDRVPDLAVGRWPVDNPADVAALVERTLAYESGEVIDRAIFSADGTSSEFEFLSDSILQGGNFDDGDVDRLYGVPSDQLVNAWNEGAWLVTYAGHGSLDRWGKEDVFSSDTVADLESASSPPIVLQLTCLTGFFAHPSLKSISEEMLLHKDGPVLIVAATSLTLSSDQQPFGISLLQALKNPDILRIGDALQHAKNSLVVDGNGGLRAIRDTFGLLCDPSAMILRPPVESG